MNTILFRYSLRSVTLKRHLSTALAFRSFGISHPMSNYLHRPNFQPVPGKALPHHAFPLRTTQSLASLHLRPFFSRQASTPPNLNLFRRDNLLLQGEFHRDQAYGLAGYLLGALGMTVSVESLSTWAPDIHANEPKGALMQIVILSDTQTRFVLGVHICVRYAVCEWVIGTVEAMANHPNGRPGRIRAGIKNYSRTGQTFPPTNQLSNAGSHGLKRPRSFVHNHGGTSHRPQRSLLTSNSQTVAQKTRPISRPNTPPSSFRVTPKSSINIELVIGPGG